MAPPKDYDEALEVIDGLSSDLDAMERDLKILRQENELLKRGRFGRSSERIDPGQLAFFQGKGGAPKLRRELPAVARGQDHRRASSAKN